MFGILGLLVTVGIMAFLAVQVLDGVGGAGSDTADDVSADVSAGGATTTPIVSNPADATDAARATSCDVMLRTVATAAEAYNAMNGEYPPDLQTLVTAGLLESDEPIDAELGAEAGALVVTGTGPCAGR